jgi:type III pantothenate kinase
MEDKWLVVDIGNSRIKFGAFEKNNVIYTGSGVDSLKEKLAAHTFKATIVSSVASDEVTNEVLNLLHQPLIASSRLKLPIENLYQTPETLGLDRLANAVAIHFLSKESAALAIDLGTCLKFDFVNRQGQYEGGAISPGLMMRFKAMNHFTANLPMVEEWSNKRLIGRSTQESLVAGGWVGMENEIFGTIDRYQEENKDLKIFVTGGDLKYFDFERKNAIFADENLTLLGLKLILELNG